MFTWGAKCSNGQPLAEIISVAGTIATNPDTIEFTYTTELYCGGTLSCVENGKFSGHRSAGTAQSAAGSWNGDQTWTVQCCSARNALPKSR
jgi:hypothetical protein